MAAIFAGRTARERGKSLRIAAIDGAKKIGAKILISAGGRSVPKSGSDGSGYALAQAFGHTVTQTFPALVPLVVTKEHWITAISGTSVEAELAVKSPTGRVLQRHRGSMLFTHFGL